jgi:hypothetical protein
MAPIARISVRAHLVDLLRLAAEAPYDLPEDESSHAVLELGRGLGLTGEVEEHGVKRRKVHGCVLIPESSSQLSLDRQQHG